MSERVTIVAVEVLPPGVRVPASATKEKTRRAPRVYESIILNLFIDLLVS
jgi:hypothetical protein